MWLGVFLFLTVVVAAFIQTAAGFAFAITTMSLWPLVLSVPDATQLVMFGAFLVIAYVAFKYRRHINFRIALVPIVLAMAGNTIGVHFLLSLDNSVMVKILGAVLILLAIFLLAFGDRVRLTPSVLSASVAGTVSGLMSGLFNIPGPPMVLYYSVVARTKEEYIGTLQFFFIVTLTYKMILMLVRRGMPGPVLTYTPVVVGGSILGMAIGLKVFRSLSATRIRQLVLALMVISGVWYLIR